MPLRLTTLLGKFEPTKFHEVTIASEFQTWLSNVGIVSAEKMLSKNRLPIEVREPKTSLIISRDTIISTYHKDGGGAYDSAELTVHESGLSRLESGKIPSILWLIVWSNGLATELMDSNWNEIRYSPYDVVLFNNHWILRSTHP